VILINPIWFIILLLVLAMVKLHTKFEVPRFRPTRSKVRKVIICLNLYTPLDLPLPNLYILPYTSKKFVDTNQLFFQIILFSV